MSSLRAALQLILLIRWRTLENLGDYHSTSTYLILLVWRRVSQGSEALHAVTGVKLRGNFRQIVCHNLSRINIFIVNVTGSRVRLIPVPPTC